MLTHDLLYLLADMGIPCHHLQLHERPSTTWSSDHLTRSINAVLTLVHCQVHITTASLRDSNGEAPAEIPFEFRIMKIPTLHCHADQVMLRNPRRGDATIHPGTLQETLTRGSSIAPSLPTIRAAVDLGPGTTECSVYASMDTGREVWGSRAVEGRRQ